MGDSATYEFGFHTRAEALLNKELFSDVEIQVIDGNNHKTFHAHKLFLAMGSKEFAKLFYENSESPKICKIFDFKPQTVFLMLQFLYADRINIVSIEELKDVYRLAKKYAVKDLEKYCTNVLAKEAISLDNIFDMYEFALAENIFNTLKICRNLVSVNAVEFFKSPQFTDAPFSVVEDILKLDSLNVKSELDVLTAAVEWAKQECYRRGAYTESPRICLYPLFKHIRFLNFTAIEFCDFVENHQDILNSHESTMLTMAILQPGSGARLPKGFIDTTRRREYLDSESSPRENIPSIPKKDFVFKESQTALPANSLSDNLDHYFAKSSENTKTFDFDQSIQDHLHDNFGVGFQKDQNMDKKNNFPQSSREMKAPKNSSINRSHLPSLRLETTELSKLNDCNNLLEMTNKYNDKSDHFVDQYKKPRPPSPVYKRSDSAPNYVKKQATPVNKVMPHSLSVSQRRSFDFPICEFGKGINAAFLSDIQCSADIYLHKGAIEVYGVELKIQPKSSVQEIIQAHIDLSGSNFSSKSMLKNEKLIKDQCLIMFEEPLKLNQQDNLKIVVLVEDLVLSRLYGFMSEKCELNCGLYVKAEIIMKSNRSNNERTGFFFLISRLLYKPC